MQAKSAANTKGIDPVDIPESIHRVRFVDRINLFMCPRNIHASDLLVRRCMSMIALSHLAGLLAYIIQCSTQICKHTYQVAETARRCFNNG